MSLISGNASTMNTPQNSARQLWTMGEKRAKKGHEGKVGNYWFAIEYIKLI